MTLGHAREVLIEQASEGLTEALMKVSHKTAETLEYLSVDEFKKLISSAEFKEAISTSAETHMRMLMDFERERVRLKLENCNLLN